MTDDTPADPEVEAILACYRGSFPEAVVLGRTEVAWDLRKQAVRGGEGTVRLNGRVLKLPDHDWLVEVPVEPAWLKASNDLRFETSGDGYRVDVASLTVDVPAAD